MFKDSRIVKLVRTSVNMLSLLYGQFGATVFKGAMGLVSFVKDFRNYTSMDGNSRFKTSVRFFQPMLRDRTGSTPLDPVYFYQDSWAAGKIFKLKPSHHYDVGSSAKFVGIISQFVPVTMIDIRPVELKLENLHFRKGSLLALPFEDSSIESLSTLCVVEHIGLGRYSDPLDPNGSEKAIKELKRVLRPGGDLLFSVPVDVECRVYFNAHRSFTRDYVMELFKDMELIEERYIYGDYVHGSYDKSRGFGTGLYHFRKVK